MMESWEISVWFLLKGKDLMWNQQVEEPQHQLTVDLGVSLHSTSYKIFAS